MNYFTFAVCSFLVFGFASARQECRCSVMIVGEDVFVAYEIEDLYFDHECDQLDACKGKCSEAVANETNDGDLLSHPEDLGGWSVGDFGCQLLGVDVANATGEVAASLCGGQWVKTDFEFKDTFCCSKGRLCVSERTNSFRIHRQGSDIWADIKGFKRSR